MLSSRGQMTFVPEKKTAHTRFQANLTLSASRIRSNNVMSQSSDVANALSRACADDSPGSHTTPTR